MVNGKQLSIADLPKLLSLSPGAGDGDYQLSPAYANAPELTPHSDVPKGTVYRFRMNSTDSALYSGIAKDRSGQLVPYSHRILEESERVVCRYQKQM
ncbi:MAG: putative esterase [Chthonomonadales bacterium]|nr:putative esterase [Chthonomonadales bacterium]